LIATIFHWGPVELYDLDDLRLTFWYDQADEIAEARSKAGQI